MDKVFEILVTIKEDKEEAASVLEEIGDKISGAKWALDGAIPGESGINLLVRATEEGVAVEGARELLKESFPDNSFEISASYEVVAEDRVRGELTQKLDRLKKREVVLEARLEKIRRDREEAEHRLAIHIMEDVDMQPLLEVGARLFEGVGKIRTVAGSTTIEVLVPETLPESEFDTVVERHFKFLGVLAENLPDGVFRILKCPLTIVDEEDMEFEEYLEDLHERALQVPTMSIEEALEHVDLNALFNEEQT